MILYYDESMDCNSIIGKLVRSISNRKSFMKKINLYILDNA